MELAKFHSSFVYRHWLLFEAGETTVFTHKVLPVVICLAASLLLSACNETSQPATKAVSADSSLALSQNQTDLNLRLAEAAKPYQGVTIRGISENTPASTYVKDVLAPEFEAVTGIKVDMEVTSYDRMSNLPIEDMEAGTGIYDFIYVEQDFIYNYLEKGYLVNITQSLNDSPQLALPEFNPVDFTSFIDEFKDPTSGHLYGVPMEAFLKTYLYRKDLFEDPKIQAAFVAEYQYPLAPAVTIEQYRDNAAFFFKIRPGK